MIARFFNKHSGSRSIANTRIKERNYVLVALLSCVLFLPSICGICIFFVRTIVGVAKTPEVLRDFVAGNWWKSFLDVTIRVPVVLVVVIMMIFVLGFVLIKGHRTVSISQMVLMVTPHICVAVALSFLLFPTGLIARVLQAFSVSGYEYRGTRIALGLTLICKMVPFVILPLLHQIRDKTILREYQFAQTLGHSEGSAWAIVVFPQVLYKLIPLLCVVAVYTISPVDISFILGSRDPAAVGVRIQQLYFLPFAQLRLQARVAAAIVILLSLGIVIGIWKLTGALNTGITGLSSRGAIRTVWGKCFGATGHVTNMFFVLAMLAVMVILCMWAYARRWEYPSVFPQEWDAGILMSSWKTLVPVIEQSIVIAAWSAAIGVCGVLFIHELMRGSYMTKNVFFVILSLLLIPDIFKTICINDFFLLTRRHGSMSAVIWAHVQTVLPYCYVMLYGTLTRFNYRYMHSVYLLGKNYMHAVIRVYIPLLLPEIMLAFLFGMLVSLGQYTSTIFVGGGRIQTLLVWLVSLSSGRDRRLLASTGVLLMLLQLALVLCFLACIFYLRRSTLLQSLKTSSRVYKTRRQEGIR